MYNFSDVSAVTTISYYQGPIEDLIVLKNWWAISVAHTSPGSIANVATVRYKNHLKVENISAYGKVFIKILFILVVFYSLFEIYRSKIWQSIPDNIDRHKEKYLVKFVPT